MVAGIVGGETAEIGVVANKGGEFLSCSLIQPEITEGGVDQVHSQEAGFFPQFRETVDKSQGFVMGMAPGPVLRVFHIRIMKL